MIVDSSCCAYKGLDGGFVAFIVYRIILLLLVVWLAGVTQMFLIRWFLLLD